MGQTIIDKTTDPVLDKNNIDEVISNINTKKSALHGEQKLQTAKTNATNAVNNLTNLNTHKRRFKNEIKASSTRTQVTAEHAKRLPLMMLCSH